MRERSPGHWQLRAYAGRDPISGRPRQAARTFRGGERAAAKALAALVTDVETGRFNSSTATLSELFDKWLEAGEWTQRPRTLYTNRISIDSRIRPMLGHIQLAELAPDVLDLAYRKWLEDGLSPATVQRFHGILSAACRQAVKWGWIDEAPTARSTPPRVEKSEMKVPTPAQVSALIEAAEDKDPVLGTAVALAALTGARRGELVALRWSDIDLVNGKVKIARSLTVARGKHHAGPTKTHASRDVALDQMAVDVLKKRWAFMVEVSDRTRSPIVPDPFVLSYQTDGAVSVNPDTVTHRFRKVCEQMERPALERLRQTFPMAKRADLTPTDRWPYRFHDLRHFSVTTLIAAGVDVRTVSNRHGHANATMTLNRYAHALPERDREAATLLGATLTSNRSV
jgi:integrase